MGGIFPVIMNTNESDKTREKPDPPKRPVDPPGPPAVPPGHRDDKPPQPDRRHG